MPHIVAHLRRSRLLLVLLLVACHPRLPSQTPTPRYLVTAAPIEVGLGNLGLCIAVDPLDQHGVWWWQPGATGCATRSTGPDVFHGEEATVTTATPTGVTAVGFRLQTHSSTHPYIDVRLVLEENGIRTVQSGARVSLQRRRNLDIPERAPMGPRSAKLESQCLDARIPAAIHAKYKNIRDAKDWRNPKFTIRDDGVEVVSGAVRGGRKIVQSGELRGFLVGLPVKAWPYGRVVLASDTGLREADRRDENSIRENRVRTETILKALGIEVDWWPSWSEACP
jgi:hypothetical protein